MAELLKRKAFITSTRQTVKEMKEQMSSPGASSGDRKNHQALLGERGPSGPIWQPGGNKYSRLDSQLQNANSQCIEEQQGQQQLIAEQQDEQLELVSGTIGVLKNMSERIGMELDEQSVMLDDFTHEVDNTHSRLDSVMKKLAKVSHMTSALINLSTGVQRILLDSTGLNKTLLDSIGLHQNSIPLHLTIDSIRLYKTLSDSIGLLQTLSDSIGLYLTLLIARRLHQSLLESIVPFCTSTRPYLTELDSPDLWSLPDSIPLHLTIDSVGLCRTLLDSFGLYPTPPVDSIGLYQTLLDSTGPHWTLLISRRSPPDTTDSAGLYHTPPDSTGPHWTRLDITGFYCTSPDLQLSDSTRLYQTLLISPDLQLSDSTRLYQTLLISPDLQRTPPDSTTLHRTLSDSPDLQRTLPHSTGLYQTLLISNGLYHTQPDSIRLS
ncbi:hypothetical protein NQZ68_032895 [Dissostichus eleginoides]|nr:hypothetical protein NQZ68_032895 [Dissostichus eleginoides]